MRKYLVEVGILLAVVCGIYFLVIREVDTAHTKALLEVRQVEHKVSAKVMTKRDADRVQRVVKEKQDEQALQAALAAHPDWADQPVPDDVIDAIGL